MIKNNMTTLKTYFKFRRCFNKSTSRVIFICAPLNDAFVKVECLLNSEFEKIWHDLFWGSEPELVWR